MTMVQHYIQAPEIKSDFASGFAADWRPGKRLAIVQPGFVEFLPAAILTSVLVVTIIGLGAIWGALSGDFAEAVFFSVKIAMGMCAVSIVFFMVLNRCFPERETVIDWQEGNIRTRKGRRWRTYALSDLSRIRVTEDRLNDHLTAASLQLVVAGEPVELLSSNGCDAFIDACGAVVVAGERLAETCGVSFELPDGIDRWDLPTVSGRELAQGYVKDGNYCIRELRLAEEADDASLVERFRNEAIDYFALANRCDPEFATPLLEIAKLTDEGGFRLQAIQLALEADSNSSVALIERAELRRKQGHYDSAESDYDAAIRIERSAESLQSRSVLHFDRDDFDASIEDLSEAIALNDNQNLLPYLLDSRARSYHARYEVANEKGCLKLAVADWRQAVKLDPDMIVSHDCKLLDSDVEDADDDQG